MSNSKSKNPDPPSGDDPRLKSFLRQARAVIAAERGLNRQSQLKLQALAESIRLPDELFRLAIDKLKLTREPSEVAHWERAFVKFLDNEFKKLPREIVTISMESRAVDLARRKYQLSDIRARQLIAERADALGLGLVSHGEATNFVKQLIANRVGDKTTIDSRVRDQLYQSGQTWGLEREQVDEFVLDQLVRNRRTGRGRVVARLAVVGMFLMLGGAIAFAGYRFSWLDKIDTFLDSQTHVGTVANPVLTVPEVQPEVVANAWWSDEIRTQADDLKQGMPPLRSALTKLEDPLATIRIDGFDELLSVLCHSEAVSSPQIESLFGELFFLEPDDRVYHAIVEKLQKLLKPEGLGGLISLAKLQAAYRANKLMSLLCFQTWQDSDARNRTRQENLIDRANTILGLETAGNNYEEHQRQSESALALAQWNYVVQTCWSSPSRCALVVRPLYDLTKNRLEPSLIDQFRQRAIESILNVDQHRWRELTTAIEDAIEVADEIRVNDWIRYYQSVEDREFGDFLRERLATKTGIANSSIQKTEVERLLSEVRLSYQKKLLQPFLVRIDSVDQLSYQARNALKLQADEVSPELVARIAFAANASLAMAIATRRNDGNFDIVNKIIKDGWPSLRQLVPLAADRAVARGPAITTPSASETRQKTELIGKISDFQNMSKTSRQTTIEQLGRIAGRFEQVSYKEAVVVADYLLSPMPIDEWLNVEKNMSSLKHWPNLALAIADRLPHSAVDLDQALTIYRLMFDDEFSPAKSANWRTEIANHLYSSALTSLQSNASNEFSAEKLDWRRLKNYLPRLHENRFRLIGELLQDPNPLQYQSGSSRENNWNVRSVELLMFDRKTSRSNADGINRLVGLISQYGRNELEQTVLANQALFEIMAERMIREIPQRKREIEALRLEYDASVVSTELVGQRLQLTELALLQLWDILRAENLELLYTRS